MLRSVFTPNRTECNRDHDKTPNNPKPIPGPGGAARSTYPPPDRQNLRLERRRPSLVYGLGDDGRDAHG
jgi:hypothetical protein